MVTKRRTDSARAVYQRRRRAVDAWRVLQQQIPLHTPTQLQQLHPEISRATLFRRIAVARAIDANTPSPDACHPVSLPSFLTRNAHQQVFTVQQEATLADNIRNIVDSKYRVVNKTIIRKMAVDYYHLLHPRAARSMRQFSAPSAWIHRFKVRHGFCRSKIKVVRKIKESKKEDYEQMKYEYVCHVEEAVQKYGGDRVINMDETPANVCEMPLTGWKPKENAKLVIGTWGDQKKQITLMPAVTVSGKKLPLAWIHKAKTYRAVSSMKIPGSIRTYISNKGWVTGPVMLNYIKEVIVPYLAGHAGALLVDDYGAHWTDAVEELAAQHNIQLIHVPPTTTAECQPLDVAVMGPFKRIRERLANEYRWDHIACADDVVECVNRSYAAYNLIDKDTIVKGWRDAVPTLDI